MNSDSKPLKRYIVLLDKAPFILFLESAKYLPGVDHIMPVLKNFNLSVTDTLVTVTIKPEEDLRGMISRTNTLPDPLAYNIIEALSDALPQPSGNFPKTCFTSADWQRFIKWQNVDDKPTPAKQFAITVDKFTHKLHMIDAGYVLDNGEDFEAVIHIDSVDVNAPFSKSLLKECVIEIHNIIVNMIKGRTFDCITQSKYVSVMQTGHNTFNWVNLKKLEKDLKSSIEAFGITVEE